VVSDNLNVIYRGPNVVETARDNPAPGLITWVIASHHQIEAMKLASQSLSIKYKVIIEVDVRTR
jgi:ABC-type sugar transport system ATPase subunit